MSETIESIIGRWRRLQPEARKMAWVGLTEKERREVEFALAPCPEESPTGCLSALFPAHPPASPPPTSRLRLATSAYELELSSLSGDEFQTALNTVMLLVRGSSETPTVDVAAEPAIKERALRAELMQRRGNISKLNLQMAVYTAGEIPLHLLNQLEAEEKRVTDVQRQLDAINDVT